MWSERASIEGSRRMVSSLNDERFKKWLADAVFSTTYGKSA